MTVFGTTRQVHRRAARRPALEPSQTTTWRRCGPCSRPARRWLPESFDYVYRDIKRGRLHCRRSPAAPTSSPASRWATRSLPVWRGELQCRGLGMAVEVFDDDGQAASSARRASWSARGRSRRMPVGFWNDPDGSKYRAAYFERFPERLVPRRLRRAHRARRRDHLRPLRRGAQPRRRAHRHRRDLPPGREARRGRRERSSSARTGRATCGSCCSCVLRDGRRAGRRAAADASARTIRDNTTPRHVPAKIVAGGRHPAHHQRQDRRAGGAQRGPRPRRSRTPMRWPTPRRWNSSATGPSWPATEHGRRSSPGPLALYRTELKRCSFTADPDQAGSPPVSKICISD